MRAEEALCRATETLNGDVAVETDAFVEDPADVCSESPSTSTFSSAGRGYGPRRAVLLGGVSRWLTAEAQCPVIVVPRGVKASLEGLMEASPGAAAAG